ncbi:hypothetical protein [Saccharopolyspora sp. NPDC002686]|uniref:hypothetical protein n=1 Tax=Saccharopolyspora sp. NPDC002686 TaxID=3154541 RepID=UPI00331E0927
MTVILARRSVGKESQRAVHAWAADQQGAVVRALCGETARVDDLERCDQVGMPCDECVVIAAALASDEHPPAPQPQQAPDVPYAVDWDDPSICHDVPELPIVGSLNGQPVVVTACRKSAWLRSGTPSGQRCPACQRNQDRAELDVCGANR